MPQINRRSLLYAFGIASVTPLLSAQTGTRKAVVAKPTTEASKLTGVQVDPAVNQRPTTAVMIENSTAARPQSGLDQAGVVFEAIAEGGITRFEAIYQDSQPAYLGPVRSVRPYYIQWALGFDAAIAHVGGSPEALSDIKTWNAKDLDQFAQAIQAQLEASQKRQVRLNRLLFATAVVAAASLALSLVLFFK